MEFNYDETKGLTQVTIVKDKDICAKCDIEIRENCPLLMAFIENIVYPCCQTLEIASCPLYDAVQDLITEDET